MNLSDTLDLMKLELEDPNESSFTKQFKVDALTTGEHELCNMLDPDLLTELETLASNKAIPSNGFTLNANNLGYTVLQGRNGIMSVKIYGGEYCNPIPVDNLKKLEISFLAGSRTNPVHYVLQNKLFVNNGETTPYVDIYYRKHPDPLNFAFTSDECGAGASSTQFDGDADDGLSSSDDYYNGIPIFHRQTDQYFIITDYDGTNKRFTVQPDRGTNFADGNEFYFLTNGFQNENYDQIEFSLNESYHHLIRKMAMVTCWGRVNEVARGGALLKEVYDEVGKLNNDAAKKRGDA